MHFMVSNVCKVFATETVGSRVRPGREATLRAKLEMALDLAKFGDNGKAFAVMTESVYDDLVSGDVSKTGRKFDDLRLREWRGQPVVCVRREAVSDDDQRPKFVMAIFYSIETYLADPETKGDTKETAHVLERLRDDKPEAVLVALIASRGPSPALGPFRLAANLAGSNSDFVAPVDKFEGLASQERLELMMKFAAFVQDHAAKTVEYDTSWALVAD